MTFFARLSVCGSVRLGGWGDGSRKAVELALLLRGCHWGQRVCASTPSRLSSPPVLRSLRMANPAPVSRRGATLLLDLRRCACATRAVARACALTSLCFAPAFPSRLVLADIVCAGIAGGAWIVAYPPRSVACLHEWAPSRCRERGGYTPRTEARRSSLDGVRVLALSSLGPAPPLWVVHVCVLR